MGMHQAVKTCDGDFADVRLSPDTADTTQRILPALLQAGLASSQPCCTSPVSMIMQAYP